MRCQKLKNYTRMIFAHLSITFSSATDFCLWPVSLEESAVFRWNISRIFTQKEDGNCSLDE